MNSEIRTKRFSLEVELLEDLHTGTGTGGGGIDSIQAIDRHGRPVIRATHIKGILRSSAEELHTLNPEKFKSNHIERLFGTIPDQADDSSDADGQSDAKVLQNVGATNWSRGGELVVGSLKQVNDVKKTLADRLLWSSTSRKLNNRAPQDDTLRLVEFVSAGTKFRAQIAVRDSDLVDILKAAVKHTDRLGSSRSRGAGLVKMTVKPLSPDTIGKSQKHELPEYQGHADKLKLRLLLRNEEPLCLPVTGVPGNIIRTESYIRGQSLAGALSAWALERGIKAEIIFDRKVSVGNAMPLPVSGNPEFASRDLEFLDVVPIPLSIQTPKLNLAGNRSPDDSWPHWANLTTPHSILGKRGEKDSIYDSTEDVSKPKRPKDREFLFRKSETGGWTRFAPEVGYHLRNQVISANRKTADEQSLFAEEEIAEETFFLADVCFYDKSAAKTFWKDFNPVLNGSEWLRIGRGGRPVTIVEASWIPCQKDTANSRDNSETLTITLESDLIARSSNLGFFNGLDCAALEELTGLDDLSKVPLEKSYSDLVEVRGFNAASGLPRSPVLAIRRGSVFRLTGDHAPILRQFLNTALSEMKWLGERTWEGFGRFRIDFNPLETGPSIQEKPTAPPDVFVDNPEEAILRKSEKLAKSLYKLPPSKSQWQFLRNNALAAGDMQSLLDMLDKLTEQSETTKAGKVWSKVLPKIQGSIEDDLVSKDIAKARLFLDTLVRWVLVYKPREKNQ